MSKRNDKKEDSSNTTGKVLTGLAVGLIGAAAGAAIGYFGRQLFQPEECKSSGKESCAEKMAKEEQNDNGRANRGNSPPGDRLSTGNKAAAEASTSRGVNSSSSPPDQMSLSLHSQLVNYYNEYVKIPDSALTEAQKIVDQIVSLVGATVRDPRKLSLPGVKIGDLVPFGSTTEGLKVIRPDVFDVAIPVWIQSECTIATSKTRDYSNIAVSGSDTCSIWCDGNGCLISTSLVQSLLLPVGQACGSSRHDVDVTLNGPTIVACFHLAPDQLVSIKFVPSVIMDNKLYIPRQPTDASDAEIDWTVLYSRQEQWSVDRFDSSITGHQISVKILKAIRLNHREQFGRISSFHIKNLLFHVLEDLPDSSDWQEAAICERVIDLLARLSQALSERQLTHYFDQSINLLDSLSDDECTALAKFIEKKLAYNDISSLLQRNV